MPQSSLGFIINNDYESGSILPSVNIHNGNKAKNCYIKAKKISSTR